MQIEIPDRVCLRCYNQQERFRFPFFVYCSHTHTLALIASDSEHRTFECAPDQVDDAKKSCVGFG